MEEYHAISQAAVSPPIVNDTNETMTSRQLYASQLSPTVDLVFGIYLLFVLVTSVFLNGIVLVTMCRRKRRTPPLEVYIIHLAIVDITMATVSYPLSATSSISSRWLYGSTGCTLAAFVVYFFSVASINTLAAMAFMRYILVCKFNMGKYLTHRVVLSTFVPIYASALLFSVGPLFGWGRYGLEPHGLSCALDWRHLSDSYVTSIFLLVYALPVTLIVYCYVSIIVTVRNTRHRVTTSSNGMEHYLTKLTVALTICFLVAWTPYAIVALSYYLYDYSRVPIQLSVAAVLLAKSSTLLNPVVYFFSVKTFRRDLKSVFSINLEQAEVTNGSSAEGIGLVKRKQMSRSNLDMSISVNPPAGSNGCHPHPPPSPHPQANLPLLDTTHQQAPPNLDNPEANCEQDQELGEALLEYNHSTANNKFGQFLHVNET